MVPPRVARSSRTWLPPSRIQNEIEVWYSNSWNHVQHFGHNCVQLCRLRSTPATVELRVCHGSPIGIRRLRKAEAVS
jgi:hypothetical protein